MKTQVILTVDDLTELVKAAMEYNGKHVVDLEFHAPDGSQAQLGSVVVECEESGLLVRVAPEESTSSAVVRRMYEESMQNAPFADKP